MAHSLKENRRKEDKIKYSNFPLTRINFVLMAICGAMIVIGFLLMLGGSNQLDQFNADLQLTPHRGWSNHSVSGFRGYGICNNLQEKINLAYWHGRTVEAEIRAWRSCADAVDVCCD